MKYFEDIEVGDKAFYKGPTVTKEAIFAFAREWDPQPHHLDIDAANASILDGLSASGWHSCCLLMQMITNNPANPIAFLGAPGIEESRWKRPVMAGDTLHASSKVVDKRPSKSKPFMGLVKRHFEMFNQKDELVLTMEGWTMIARWPDAGARGE